MTNDELATSVAAERGAEGGLDNLGLELRRSLWACANDAAMRLAKAAGTYEYGGAQQAFVDFVNGALRCAASAAADPTSDDLARLEVAGIAVDESSLTSDEVSAAMGLERGYFKMSTRVPEFDFRTNRWNLVDDAMDHYSGLTRRNLWACANDASTRLDTALGFPPFVNLNKTAQTFLAASVRLAVLATDDPSDADTARLVAAGLT